jgi:hypothetical protein
VIAPLGRHARAAVIATSLWHRNAVRAEYRTQGEAGPSGTDPWGLQFPRSARLPTVFARPSILRFTGGSSLTARAAEGRWTTGHERPTRTAAWTASCDPLGCKHERGKHQPPAARRCRSLPSAIACERKQLIHPELAELPLAC